ncbi:hypothetical protein EniyanLRS_144 [Mycobacterium phage EniyanLRS]|nr:hypothetical protein COSMO_152 [Mycobacterium phage Cosmo]AQT25793.1 hypothetical protein EniyanLRS_144 [Mycobacterium phage EniyanLRS]QGJ90011.1 hypothetical protein PBI_MARYV_137 [Mycobacterium phage MaryV]WKR36133.1 hypothetical protein [Mycobacterium phage Azrael100]
MSEVLFKGEKRMMWRKLNDPTHWFVKRGWTFVETDSIPVSINSFGTTFGITIIRRTWKKRKMVAEFITEHPHF